MTNNLKKIIKNRLQELIENEYSIEEIKEYNDKDSWEMVIEENYDMDADGVYDDENGGFLPEIEKEIAASVKAAIKETNIRLKKMDAAIKAAKKAFING